MEVRSSQRGGCRYVEFAARADILVRIYPNSLPVFLCRAARGRHLSPGGCTYGACGRLGK